MIIYNYDEFTKEYTGYCNADLDPEETKRQGKNVYLIPANATAQKPPKVKEVMHRQAKNKFKRFWKMIYSI